MATEIVLGETQKHPLEGKVQFIGDPTKGEHVTGYLTPPALPEDPIALGDWRDTIHDDAQAVVDEAQPWIDELIEEDGPYEDKWDW